MLKSENELYALSLGITKCLACEFSTPELAVIASFFSNLATNIGMHIQVGNLRKFCELQAAGNGAEDDDMIGDELVATLPFAEDDEL